MKAQVWIGCGAPGVKAAKPEKAECRWVHMVSAENVKFLTGVQRVTCPIWATSKFGLQV